MSDDTRNKLNHFISEHAGLINMHANMLKNKGMLPEHMSLQDLHEAGILGLMHAVTHYNDAVAQAHANKPDANHFANYAGGWIKGKMMERLKQEDQVPLYFRRKSAEIKRKQDFQQATPQVQPENPPSVPPPADQKS